MMALAICDLRLAIVPPFAAVVTQVANLLPQLRDRLTVGAVLEMDGSGGFITRDILTDRDQSALRVGEGPSSRSTPRGTG